MRDEKNQPSSSTQGTSGSPSEQDLARALLEGSPDAVQQIRQRVRKIVGFRGYRVPAEDRNDLEQEVMTQIWQAVNRSGFDGQKSFWGFVEVVAARRCIDWLRSRRREVDLDENLAADDDSLDSAIAGERLRLARGALAQLGQPCRELVHLHVGLGKPYRELARLLGKSEGALRVQMHRCIREARRALAQLEQGQGSGDTSAKGG